MGPRRLRWSGAALTVAASLIAGCSGDDDPPATATLTAGDTGATDPTAAPTDDPTTPSTATDTGLATGPGSTATTGTDTAAGTRPSDGVTPPEDPDADLRMCDTYLDYLGAQDVDDLVGALESLRDEHADLVPTAAAEAIEVLLTDQDADPGEVAGAVADLGTSMQEPCGDYFAERVTGADSDEDAARRFWAALLVGDREVAVPVAPLDVLAQFDPWEPLPLSDEVDAPAMSYADRTMSMVLAPTVTVSCRVADGVVATCGFGE